MSRLKVLIGCETSGIVRRAFEALGHDVWSCDINPSEDNSNRHITGDIRYVMMEDWDLMAVMHQTNQFRGQVAPHTPSRPHHTRDVAGTG